MSSHTMMTFQFVLACFMFYGNLSFIANFIRTICVSCDPILVADDGWHA